MPLSAQDGGTHDGAVRDSAYHPVSSGGFGGGRDAGTGGGGRDATAGAGGAGGQAGASDADAARTSTGGSGTGGMAGTGKGGQIATGGRGSGGVATGGSAGVPVTGGVGTGGRGGGAGSVAGGGAGAGGVATGGARTGGAGTGGAGTGGVGIDAGTPGKPLWRSSYRPFCQKKGGTFPLVMGVWSDARAVSVLVYDAQNAPVLWNNPGTGWQVAYTWPKGTVATSGPGKVGVKGLANGPLFVYGVQPCWIQLVDGASVTCSGAARDIADVALVDADLGYAAYSDRLLRFDGSLWTQLGAPLPMASLTQALWADPSTILVAADRGTVYILATEGEPVLQTGLPAVDLTAAWGFSAKDLWIGNRDGQLFHYDGAAWSLVGTMATDGGGVIKLWGADGNLFAITATAFARWDGTRLTMIETLPEGVLYKDLWGNSPKEVFVTRYDWLDEECGAFQMRWFDGAVVGRL
jgi:hypothetical protein